MLIFTILTLVAQTALCVYVVVSVKDWEGDGGMILDCQSLFWLNVVSLCLNVIFGGLLIYLICYHEWLMRRSMTTF